MATAFREVMTEGVVTVESSASIPDAARRMRDEDIGDVVVTDGQQVRGIVTDRDIAVRRVAEWQDLATHTVGEICSTDVVTVEPDADVHEAAQKMREASVRRLPVIENGTPIDIVSIGDLAVAIDPDSALAEISADVPNN